MSIVEGRVTVSARIGDKRYQLRLRGGPGFRRQRAAVEQIVSGAATQGELALYQRGDDIMVKMVAWLPRSESVRRQQGQYSGTISVRTDHESMLVAINAKDERLWIYHGDHILRWSAEHRGQLQRWADDTKAEQRPVPSFAARRTDATRKYRNRMSTAAKEITSMLCGYAARKKFAVLSYSDSDTSFCPGFPWYSLRGFIATKLDELGITFEHVSAPGPPESGASLAETALQ